MPTNKQQLGALGENFVIKKISCPKCKKIKTLKKLPTNFKCADLICDFCGFLAQVKSKKVDDINKLPPKILGAAWMPQKERMNEGIFFSLYLVLVNKKKKSIFYLSDKFQSRKIFIARKPLSKKAKRSGWQGFIYDTKNVKDKFKRIF